MAECSTKNHAVEEEDVSVSNGLQNATEICNGSVEASSNAPRLTVSTPLLVEDIRDDVLPASVSCLLEHLRGGGEEGASLNEHDMLFAFMYVIMLEMGFVPSECVDDVPAASVSYNRQQVLKLCTMMPETWKRSANVYDVTFMLARFNLHACRLVCTSSMPDMVVNCRLQGVRSSHSYALLLDPKMYVVESGERGRLRFQHVNQFATKFKNAIALPAKIEVMHANNVRAPTLEDLPPELKIYLESMVPTNFFDRL